MIETLKMIRPRKSHIDNRPTVFMYNRHRTVRLNAPFTVAMEVLFGPAFHIFVNAKIENKRITSITKIDEQNW